MVMKIYDFYRVNFGPSSRLFRSSSNINTFLTLSVSSNRRYWFNFWHFLGARVVAGGEACLSSSANQETCHETLNMMENDPQRTGYMISLLIGNRQSRVHLKIAPDDLDWALPTKMPLASLLPQSPNHIYVLLGCEFPCLSTSTISITRNYRR